MIIPKKYERITFALLMSGSMALVMSLVMTMVNRGFSLDVLAFWPKVFLIGYCIAFPTAYFVSPIVGKINSKIIIK
ncbi:DUF2798 domain-containing protein [Methanococcus maripaludis]|jgi:hypothetical protein|uniref:DUF2798 domain-containing protein n=5 Tax=Methanococcus maripaludis TaxID=39152 RepID=Q6M198_METMP|nr:DUF2798 domain-containing protein [Methanococcus maripaludis]MDK2928847.1 hypothetical protein [Methanococcus sp.]AEK18912.1 hypothetical protein GYY_00100 [Methanococcus maripaludis X1]MBA2847647.1 hypothetical protein [Methanococcus maripaludis]MBA2852056.1 hypothetical protein [Methanococcus maripaludis]MBA2859198.1 hypothetical protein [Methanococcus maripaludis]